MLCIAFFICLVVVWRRRSTRTTIVVPALVIALALGRLALLVMTIVNLLTAFSSLKDVPAQDKANVLAARIDDSMRYARFGLIYELPLLALAWVADVLLRRRKEEATRVAPVDAHCAVHPSESATRICLRCGSFMCAECAAADERRCPPCRERVE